MVSTRVPRIFCEINYHKRLKTGELKQYTLTILPGFLIPYSTVPLDPVHQALASYISEGGLTFVLLSAEYLCVYSRLPNTKVIAQRFVWQYMYAVFSRHNMGLGP